MKTYVMRAMLDGRVGWLEENLAHMSRRYPHEARFRIALKAYASMALQDASSEDEAWGIQQIDAMLLSYALTPLGPVIVS